MKKIISLFLIFVFFSCSMPVEAKCYKKLSQLEIREIQTHIFPTPKTKEVFKATINALQDEDFTIINIEDEIGYIRANREYKARRIDKLRATKYSLLLALSTASVVISRGSNSVRTMTDSMLKLANELSVKTVVVDANADIEPLGKQTKVRLTLVEKVLYKADGYSYVKSAPRDVIRIYNKLVYQNFFTELDKSIFYEKI